MSMTGRFIQIPEDRLADVIAEPMLAMDLAHPPADSDDQVLLDIDKSWHIIHFLLTGESWGGEGAAASAILGGTDLPDTDAGYGPFRYLTAAEVKQVAEALAGIASGELWSRLDPDKTEAAEVYPGRWGDDGEVERTYVIQNYEALRAFYARASTESHAVLLYLS